jgi:hypothetical protein
MEPGDRTAMIEGMVSGLAERLKTQPDDIEGWLRLIRSIQCWAGPMTPSRCRGPPCKACKELASVNASPRLSATSAFRRSAFPP